MSITVNEELRQLFELLPPEERAIVFGGASAKSVFLNEDADGGPSGSPVKVADGDVALSFEVAEDAQYLYYWLTEDTGLMEPGEVILVEDDDRGYYAVHFTQSALMLKPHVVQNVLYALGDFVQEGSEDKYEALAEEVSGLYEANPLHNAYGLFTNKAGIARAKRGSWALGNIQQKVKGVGKKGKVMRARTVVPCGRKARQKGSNWRCWDGKKLWTGARMAKVLKKKVKRGKKHEDFDGGIFEPSDDFYTWLSEQEVE